MIFWTLGFFALLPISHSLHVDLYVADEKCDADLCTFRAKNNGTCKEHAICKEDLMHLMCLLRVGTPFAYAHFNDGEVKAATTPRGLVDRDWQKASKELQKRMMSAIQSNTHNFYKGLACKNSFPTARKWLESKLSNSSDCFHTGATIFIDQNHAKAREEFIPILKQKRVHVVVAEGANVSDLPFQVETTVNVPDHDAFSSAERVSKELEASMHAGDVVLLMAGPLGRILAAEMFAKHQDVSFVEIGSFWDKELNVGLKGAAGWKDHPCE